MIFTQKLVTDELDQEFIRQMIPHHQSAVMMAQIVLNSATHPQIYDLTQAIIKSLQKFSRCSNGIKLGLD